MNQNTKDIVVTLIIISLCLVSIVNGIVKYQIGLDDGAASVEQRTPSFETSYTGGYVNESVYNETYYQVYKPAKYHPPPVIHNDSFIIGISIFGYYDNITDVASFGVHFSDDSLDQTNVTIEMAVTTSQRESGWEVGFYFTLDGFGAIAYAYGRMDIYLFGYGSAFGHSTIFSSYLLTIIQWEGEK